MRTILLNQNLNKMKSLPNHFETQCFKMVDLQNLSSVKNSNQNERHFDGSQRHRSC